MSLYECPGCAFVVHPDGRQNRDCAPVREPVFFVPGFCSVYYLGTRVHLCTPLGTSVLYEECCVCVRVHVSAPVNHIQMLPFVDFVNHKAGYGMPLHDVMSPDGTQVLAHELRAARAYKKVRVWGGGGGYRAVGGGGGGGCGGGCGGGGGGRGAGGG